MESVVETLPQLGLTSGITAIFAITAYVCLRMLLMYLTRREDMVQQMQKELNASHEAVIRSITEKANGEWARWRQDISSVLVDNSEAVRSLVASNEQLERSRSHDHQQLREMITEIKFLTGRHKGNG